MRSQKWYNELYDNNFETFDTEERFVDRLTKRPDARFVEMPDFRGDPLPCFNTSKRFVTSKKRTKKLKN